MDITLTELEAAINYWRAQHPASGEECALSPEVNALAGLYAMMIFEHSGSLPQDALDARQRALLDQWRAR